MGGVHACWTCIRVAKLVGRAWELSKLGQGRTVVLACGACLLEQEKKA